MGWPRAIAIVGAARHKIPHSRAIPLQAILSIVGIVKILPLEGEMTELVRANAYFAIVWDS